MSGYTGPANPIVRSNFYSSGQDISSIFQQFVVDPKTTITGISINGTDVCNYFAPYYNGTKVNNVSGFMFNGVDLQSGFSPPYALSAGTTGTYIMPLIPSTLTIISCNLNTSPATVTFTAPTIPNSISPATSTYTYKYYVNGSSTGTAGAVVSSTQTSLTGISLSAGTSYTIKVTAVNAIGESPLTSATSTTSWTVPSVPVITSGSGLASSITFYFTQSSGTVTTYTAYYSTSSVFSTSYSNVSLANTVTSATISSGITTGSSYYLFLVANNAGGSSINSTYGPIVTLIAPSAPTGITLVGSPIASSINFTFTAPSGTVDSYGIYYSTVNSYSGSLYATTASTSVTISGLTAATNYYIYITATNAAGTSGNSTIFVSCTAPNPPTGITTSLITSSSVKLSWTAPTGGNVPIQAYYIYYGTTSAPTYNTVSTVTNITLTGLSPNTIYYFTIQTIAGGYGSVVSTQITINTLVTTPIITSSKSGTSITTTVLNGFEASYFYFAISTQQSGWTTNTSFTATNLSVGTMYFPAVYSSNASQTIVSKPANTTAGLLI